MATPNQLGFIKVLLYKLKRDYGEPLEVYRLNSSVANLQTGKKTVSKTRYAIPRAIVMTSDLERLAVFSHTFLIADKQFAYGAFFDADAKNFIIDYRDLPQGFTFDLNDWVVWDGQRYEIKKVMEAEHGMAVMLLCRSVKGQPPAQVFELSVFHTLRFRQSVEGQ